MKRETVGVLGGTFDPVHLGHLHAAREVRSVFALPRVLLVPCARAPHKESFEITPAVHRLAMVRLAVSGQEDLEASTLEIDRGGTSFTIDTLRALRERGLSPLFLLGMDALLELPTWREHDRLVEEFDLVVVDRPGGSLASTRRTLGEESSRRIVPVPRAKGAGTTLAGHPPGTGGRIFHLSIPPVVVSAREIRARAAEGAPLDGLVPPLVARYIQEQALYVREGSR